jgi:hypothetical protein
MKVDTYREEVKLDKELQGILCSLAEKSGNEGRIISPRMFKWTIKMIKSQAYLQINQLLLLSN